MIYAVGDVHGEIDKLGKLIDLIRADAADSSNDKCKIVFLGDYIDRGSEPRSVVERLMKGVEGFETICLLGNHEKLMLEFASQPSSNTLRPWIVNGGYETLESYGFDREEVRDAFNSPSELGKMASEIPNTHLEWMGNLPLSHQDGRYLFVHAGVLPGKPIENQSENDILWIRGKFLESDEDHGFIVVHGHTATHSPTIRPNRIGIDTDACLRGALTCVVLELDNKPRFLQVH